MRIFGLLSLLGALSICSCQADSSVEVKKTCADIECPTNSVCQLQEEEPVCICNPGYQGELCDACAPGYQDSNSDGSCEVTCANSNLECPQNAECSHESGTAGCKCRPGYLGDDCNLCDLDNGYQDNDQDGSCLPDCILAELDCPHHSQCFDDSGQAVCVCELGYTGPDCDSCDTGFEPDEQGGCRPIPDPPAEWTLIIFLNADNNLADFGIEDVSEMAAIGSTASINIVALYDLPDQTTKKIYINQGDYEVIEDLGELDMGSWKTLADFGSWAIEAYPANRYALILWDHGSGWRNHDNDDGLPILKGFSGDDSSGNEISIAEGDYAQALSAITETLGRKLDLVGFDACLMGEWEIAEASGPFADYLLASSEVEPGEGWSYTDFLTELVAQPTMSAEELATVIIDTYYQSSPMNQILALIDLSTLDSLAQTITNLADNLLVYAGDEAMLDHLEEVRKSSQAFGAVACRDFLDFAQKLAASEQASLEVTTAATALAEQLAISIVYYQAQDTRPGAHGLTVYFPGRSFWVEAAYTAEGAIWSQRTTWDEFLDVFTKY
jgi:hypothetical protein